jgi:hypothetical protein
MQNKYQPGPGDSAPPHPRYDEETIRAQGARDVLLAHRLWCAALSGGAPDDPLADDLIWVVAAMGVQGSKCARSAHQLALDQERIGEPQRV